MTDRPPRRFAKGGGILLALGAIVGAMAGGYQGQPSLGLLIGLAAGTALAIAAWLRDRAR